MNKIYDILGTHWLALALMVAAAIVGTLGLRRNLRGRPSGFWIWPAILMAVFALGTGLIGNQQFRFAEEGTKRFIAAWILYTAGSFLVAQFVFLLIFRRWSYGLAVTMGLILCFGLGGWIGRDLTSGLYEVGKSIAWTQITRPRWLVLLAFVFFVVSVSRRSLSGLGSTRKWIAISARALVVACLVLALAEPRVRRPSEHVTVMFLVDRSFSIPQDLDTATAGQVYDRRWERVRKLIETSVAKRNPDQRNDQVGVILFGKRPRLAYPSASVNSLRIDEKAAGVLDGNYTDLGASLKLALASFPEGTSRRIVLVSDGNENLGSADEQAELAKKNGIAIDTIALAPGFRNENEVMIQAVEAPPKTTSSARLPVRVLIRNAHPTREVDGKLEVIRVGRSGEAEVTVQIPIEDSPQVLTQGNTEKSVPPLVRLRPGLNVFRFRDRIRESETTESSYTYKASFVPTQSYLKPGDPPTAGLPGDRPNNNKASAAVVARSQRRILFIDQAVGPDASPHKHLIAKLRDSKQDIVHLNIAKLPGDRNDLGVFLSSFDCIILANVPADLFTNDQMEVVRTQVHDQGCGLVMVGGPDAYGPGGYQQTPIEAALPVDCEIKAKKAMGKGGLVLVMHASEMADGNKWQKVIAKLAIQRLGPLDMIGVVDYGQWGGNVNWHIPFQEVGEDKESLLQRVDRMSPGDMPDFDPFLKASADTLAAAKDLAVRHVILISDGDPNYSNPGMLAVKKMADNGITCTTVGVATHGVAEDGRMANIANGTKDAAGQPGRYWKVTDPTQLPALYIKETRRISQSFVYDRTFTPKLILRGGPAEGLPNTLPDLRGFIRTTKKESPLCDMHIEGPMDEQSGSRFPVLASWRYGLGKAVAFTADARSIPAEKVAGWDQDWAGSDIYQKFWEQAVGWAMREAETGKMNIITEYRDGKVRIIVDARDEKDKPVIGLTLKGAVTPPSKPGTGEKPPQVEFRAKGAGQYEAEFTAEEAGAYFVRVEGTRGNNKFDAARAGVTVPYSPEFSDLETNTPLLKRISELTGGKVLSEPEDIDVNETKKLERWVADADFFRKAPESIRSILPFWFWLVFIAAVMLFVDVAARRIAFDKDEVSEGSKRIWAKLRRKPYEEPEEDASLAALMKRKQQVSDVMQKKRATRKFEIEPGTEGEAPPTSADEYTQGTTGPGALPPTPKASGPAAAPEVDDGDDFLTRMNKAKNRGKRDNK